MSEEKVSLSGKQQVAPGEVEYAPPAATVPLPSQGKVYPLDSPIHRAEFVEVKAMTAKEEDILTSRALLKSGKALDVLLRSCVINRSIDVDSMLSGDRNAVLIAIRITGYGQEYKVSIDCPCCGEKSQHTFDLAKLPIKRLGVDPTVEGKNEFTFSLPISKKQVSFKLLTGADERELSTILDRSRKASGGAETSVTTRLSFQITSLDGNTEKSNIAAFVRNMPARDSRELRRYIDDVSPGVDMVQLFSCPQCSEESEVDVPMGTEFFWPES